MYNIKFLSSKDFDGLPQEVTKGSQIDDSLGFYNPDLKTAYIRHTASDELNKYLLNHEFDHMLEDEATDVDENGIRHKKAREIFSWFAPILRPINAIRDEDPNKLVHPAAQSLTEGFFNPEVPEENEEQKKIKEQQRAMAAQQEAMYAQQPSFQSMFAQPAGNQGTQASYASGNSLPESGSSLNGSSLSGGLNQQQQTNPFASDQERFKYGAPAGRLQF